MCSFLLILLYFKRIRGSSCAFLRFIFRRIGKLIWLFFLISIFLVRTVFVVHEDFISEHVLLIARKPRVSTLD